MSVCIKWIKAPQRLLVTTTMILTVPLEALEKELGIDWLDHLSEYLYPSCSWVLELFALVTWKVT